MKEYKLYKASEEGKRLDSMINSLVVDGFEIVKVFDDKDTVLMKRDVQHSVCAKPKRTKSKQKVNE